MVGGPQEVGVVVGVVVIVVVAVSVVVEFVSTLNTWGA